MPAWLSVDLLIQASYFLTAALFIIGLKRMSSPVSARSGILWAGAGMLVATLITFLYPGMTNYELIVPAMFVGAGIAWWSGKRVAMTDMPQMIALYNGMGGGAAAAIAAVELYRGEAQGYAIPSLAVAGGIIGAISFSGSAIAFGKLQGLINRSFRFSGQQFLNLLLLLAALVIGAVIASHYNAAAMVVTALFVVALVLGITMTLPIGGADMPVVIDEPFAGQRAVLRLRRYRRGGDRRGVRIAQAHRGLRRGRHDGLRPEGDHRARLRHGSGPGAA
jgi:NAD(P) transhydrogenase subunit beta